VAEATASSTWVHGIPRLPEHGQRVLRGQPPRLTRLENQAFRHARGAALVNLQRSLVRRQRYLGGGEGGRGGRHGDVPITSRMPRSPADSTLTPSRSQSKALARM